MERAAYFQELLTPRRTRCKPFGETSCLLNDISGCLIERNGRLQLMQNYAKKFCFCLCVAQAESRVASMGGWKRTDVDHRIVAAYL